jgi:hypothetical protein
MYLPVEDGTALDASIIHGKIPIDSHKTIERNMMADNLG